MKPREMITRSVPLLDIERTGADRRTVIAYAATFDEPYEVSDQFGHYDEQIARTAFNRVLGRGFANVRVLFNHGRTVWGTPSEKWSSPLGVPEEIRADTRGLLTRTRYNATPQADEALELLESGSVTHQSFRGPVLRSAAPRRSPSGRPLIERLDLGLVEYGPGVFAVNLGAEVMAIRSMLLADDEEIAGLDPDERRDLIARLQRSLPTDSTAAPDSPPDPTAPSSDAAAPRGPDPSVLQLVNAARRRRTP